MILDDDKNSEGPSRSERKREMLALQKIGETLVKLSQSQLDQIPLDSVLATAIDAARSIKSHEAKRRQLQYIGRLMRHVDPEPIRVALEKIESKNRRSKAELHQAERWRDQLIAEDDELLQQFLTAFPEADRQQLRQLVRNAKKKMAGAEKELFRYIMKWVA